MIESCVAGERNLACCRSEKGEAQARDAKQEPNSSKEIGMDGCNVGGWRSGHRSGGAPILVQVMASHRLNAQSSRSHCLFILHIDSAPVEAPEELTSSKVTLVDLAGSERGASANPKHGALQKEAISINKSLFALRKVIMSLAEGMSLPHVPFRDSKLTCLLKHSLGGTSLTTMLACITPSDEFTEDTLSTLEYSSRAKAITNTLVVNEDPKNRLIRELRQQVAFLQDQLATVEMPIPATPGGIAWDAAEETHAAPAPPHGEHDGYGKGRSSGQAQQTDHAETTESEEALNHAASSCRLAERLLDHGEFQSSPCRPSERIGLASGVDHGEQQAEVIPQVEAMGRYLVQSTVMLKRLSTAYSSLRREYAELSERSRGAKQLNDTLMAENTDLRGKVSMYEDVVAGPLSSASGGSPIHTAGSAVLVELAELRRENELLRAWSQQGAAAAQHGNAAAAHCGHGGAAPRRCASTRAARGPGGAAGAPMANGTMSLRQLEAMLEACGGGGGGTRRGGRGGPRARGGAAAAGALPGYMRAAWGGGGRGDGAGGYAFAASSGTCLRMTTTGELLPASAGVLPPAEGRAGGGAPAAEPKALGAEERLGQLFAERGSMARARMQPRG
mmetsp:Transcript_39841/g.94652  ORF Transcript_39841/g.94652 Transcript_39841/m.94652 type:complete len:618 (+) Transcript_39841:1198-3051(+)